MHNTKKILERKQRFTINNNRIRKIVISNYFFDEHIRQILDLNCLRDENVMNHLRKTINDDENAVVFDIISIFTCRKTRHEIYRKVNSTIL